ncbi:hypothetical protein Pyn_31291 [Prunus yedoensis var. nudiflora]|uniref:Uncharacterized protein n=1 Tax=Prunus yedoensis var. nudiflora TaxID=2094558 RepID=A0A314U7G3_PRUYE|nr:hypothetical protein Pyn_31291 [Prunus yedoensis var. nudiflora]
MRDEIAVAQAGFARGLPRLMGPNPSPGWTLRARRGFGAWGYLLPELDPSAGGALRKARRLLNF